MDKRLDDAVRAVAKQAGDAVRAAQARKQQDQETGRMGSNNTGQADIAVENHGSVVILEMNTPEGLAWVKENAQTEGWMWMGINRLAVEPRLAPALLYGALQDGLSLEA